MRQDRHFATKTPGKQKRFPSGPEPNRDLSEFCRKGSCGFPFFQNVLVDYARYFTANGKVFLGAKQNKNKFCTIFQTSRFLVLFVAVSYLDFGSRFRGELFLLGFWRNFQNF